MFATYGWVNEMVWKVFKCECSAYSEKKHSKKHQALYILAEMVLCLWKRRWSNISWHYPFKMQSSMWRVAVPNKGLTIVQGSWVRVRLGGTLVRGFPGPCGELHWHFSLIGVLKERKKKKKNVYFLNTAYTNINKITDLAGLQTDKITEGVRAPIFS